MKKTNLSVAETLRLLQAARKRIASPSSFSQGVPWRDANGNPTSPLYRRSVKPVGKPVRFDINGALQPSENGSDRLCAHARRFLVKAALEVHRMSPVIVNDRLGHRAVLEVYDQAIKTAKESVRLLEEAK